MPIGNGPLRMYRTVHKAKANDLAEATYLATAYFAERGFDNVQVLASGVNALGHYDFVLTAGSMPVPERPTESEQRERVINERSLVETLTCQKCAKEFTRTLARGRKPRFCAECMGTPTLKPGAVSVAHSAPTAAPTETEGIGSEAFTCTKCFTRFTRPIVRGRKPTVCPTCKGN